MSLSSKVDRNPELIAPEGSDLTNYTEGFILYSCGYKYQLVRTTIIKLRIIRPPAQIETEWCALTPHGRLILWAGYAWDGASGPTFDTSSSMRGSAAHDALYQLCRLGLLNYLPTDELRALIDSEFHSLCLEDGMWSARAWVWLRSVVRFAGFAIKPSAERKVLRAPYPGAQL